MAFIDPHVHMAARTTDDYESMAAAGCVAVSEPSFWPGLDRTSPESFVDSFRHLTEAEPARAARHGIRHLAWICVNPKEAERISIAREVIARIPEFLGRQGVAGIGEIGLNRVTRNEIAVFEEQVELAVRTRSRILVHTPHLEDKARGTRIILEILAGHRGVDPERVLVDHVEEHTVASVLDRGFRAGITIYPGTKCSVSRAADMIERYDPGRILANSAADWGPSDPLAVARLRREMRLRGHSEERVRQVTLDNPARFLSLNEETIPSAGTG